MYIGTHYVQDINTTGSPGQLNISCEFLVDNETILGYMALVHSDDDDVNYLVTANNNEGVVTSHLKGLRSENYTTLLFAINESGLPLQQAAGFPTNVSIDRSISEQVEGTLLSWFRITDKVDVLYMLTFRTEKSRHTAGWCFGNNFTWSRFRKV